VVLACDVDVDGSACGVIADARCVTCRRPICRTHGHGRLNAPSCREHWASDPARCGDCELVATTSCAACGEARCYTHMAIESRWDDRQRIMIDFTGNECARCKTKKDEEAAAALATVFPAAIEHVARVLATRAPTAHWTHNVTTKRLLPPRVGSPCPLGHRDCRLIAIFRFRNSLKRELTYGRAAFILWQYGVQRPAARGDTIWLTRSVFLLPDGTLAFDAATGDEARDFAYNAPMVTLARSHPRMTFRDLKLAHFGQHQERGFEQFSRHLLAKSSRPKPGRPLI
jgi:hypothetical protein